MTATLRRRWTAAAASLAVNGLLLLAAVGIGADMRAASPWVEPPAMVAQLVSVRGELAPAPPDAAQAPSSEPAPSPPQPKAPALPPVKQAESAPSELYVTKADPGTPTVVQPAPAKPAPAAAPPARTGTRDGLDIPAPNGTAEDYASKLRAWLEAHKTYPKRARMRREEGVVHIHFAVDRRGRLLAGDVVRSSGHTALDDEAMAMLDRADPFPGPPHSVRGERIDVSTPVEFALRD